MLDRARQWIAKSEFGRAQDELASLKAGELPRLQGAEARYLTGLASYLEVCTELDSCGEEISYRFMGILSGGHQSRLSSACANLLAASDLAPEAPFAAEAAYLAARTQDYGFLQDFTRAMELYRWCFTAFPGTPAAERSRLRHDALKRKFDAMEGTGHGE